MSFLPSNSWAGSFWFLRGRTLVTPWSDLGCTLDGLGDALVAFRTNLAKPPAIIPGQPLVTGWTDFGTCTYGATTHGI